MPIKRNVCFSFLLCLLFVIPAAPYGEESQQQKKPTGQNPSPMAEHIRAHERLADSEPPGEIIEIPDVLPKPVELYIPGEYQPARDAILLVHFHGMGYIARQAAHEAGAQYLAVTVNLGAGSSTYARPFGDPDVFMSLVLAVSDAVEKSGGTKPKISSIYLTSFSAGYGVVREILGKRMDMIDGVVLLDSMHTGYIPSGVTLYDGGAVNGDGIRIFVDYAKKAVEGDTRFIITHSEIFPGTYASTTETAEFIIGELGLERTPVLEWGPLGMQLLGRTGKGNFRVLAFAGNTAPDHVDHLNGLPYFLNMLLEM